MKKRIALAASLLLTLGTAAGATLIYGHEQLQDDQVYDQRISTRLAAEQVTPDMIALWKSTATTADYIAPKVPI